MTIIYYTANKEDESFEEKIKEELLKNCGDLPILSVSQKPIDLGKNICVGDVGASTYNTKRQIFIGLKEAKTKYVCMAEADFLYPKEYFKFVPPKDNKVYCWGNLYVLWMHRRYFFKKNFSEGAVIADRKLLIEIMAVYLDNEPEWRMDLPKHSLPFLAKKSCIRYIPGEIPAVTFKTGNGMSLNCPHSKHTKEAELPYWGTSKLLQERFSEFV